MIRSCAALARALEPADGTGEGHDLHRCPSRHQAHGLGGACRCTRSRPESTSRRYGTEPGRTSPPGSAAVQASAQRNEKADGWTKLAAEETDATEGAEWL
jgi:hypothetical protein